VELVDHPGMFFLVQVKASKQGYSKEGRLRVTAKKEHIRSLLSLPVPAYVVAIDEPGEKAYIIRPSASKSLNSAATCYSLRDAKVRLALRDEVLGFWNRVNSANLATTSAFLD
ncbi:MAG: DUF4365 domain-containing protein, partial [Armatimonadota bacterium]|nr:DUF4365 domain-containing protein [Armatimonadota bacterium]